MINNDILLQLKQIIIFFWKVKDTGNQKNNDKVTDNDKVIDNEDKNKEKEKDAIL